MVIPCVQASQVSLAQFSVKYNDCRENSKDIIA